MRLSRGQAWTTKSLLLFETRKKTILEAGGDDVHLRNRLRCGRLSLYSNLADMTKAGLRRIKSSLVIRFLPVAVERFPLERTRIAIVGLLAESGRPAKLGLGLRLENRNVRFGTNVAIGNDVKITGLAALNFSHDVNICDQALITSETGIGLNAGTGPHRPLNIASGTCIAFGAIFGPEGHGDQ
jgi:hypothetical protein